MSIINVKGHKTISRIDNFKVGGLTYACCWGVKPNNTHWELPIHSSAAMRVLICAKITPQSSGMLFGDERFYINLNGLTIRWINPNGAVEQTVEEGEHVIGFIDGKPALDGNLLSDATLNVSTSANPCHLGSANNPDPTKLANTYIRKVELYGHATNTTDAKQSWSYYATYIGNKGYLVEKWSNTVLPIQAGGDAVPLTDAFPGYGISIEDLRQVVSTPHKDLVAIYTQDGGTTIDNTVAFAPEAAVATIEGQEVKQEMAFRWIGRSLPDGYALQEHPTLGTTQGIDGELLYGRRPVWNMWADNVNMGRYISGYDTSGESVFYNTKIRFNPMLDKYGMPKTLSDGTPGFHLLDWQNYSPTLYHKPDLRVGKLNDQEVPNFTMEFINGIEVSSDSNLSIQNPDPSINSHYAGLYKYKRIAQMEGDLKFVIGNMISWHESDYSYYAGYDGNNTPIPIPIYGAYFAVRIGNELYGEEVKVNDDVPALDGYTMMIGYKAEDKHLDSLDATTDASTIYTYREGGISVDEVSFTRMSKEAKDHIRQYASEHEGNIPCFTEFGLLGATKSAIVNNGGIVPNSALISGRLMAPTKQVTVTLEEKESTYPMFFVKGFDSNLFVLCSNSGYSHIITQYGDSSSSEEGIILGMVVTEDGNYVGKKITATLTANWIDTTTKEEKTRVIGTVESQVRSGLLNTNPLYMQWRSAAPSFVHKSETPIENVWETCVETDIAQILMWDITQDNMADLTYRDESGVYPVVRVKPNISFILQIDSVGDTPTPTLMNFSINGELFEAAQGMTWEVWCTSAYNTSRYSIKDGYVVINIDGELYYVQDNNGVDITASEIIRSESYIVSR